ncbi:MAG TPA: glycosyl hydrolase [Candidatus Lokiarchaeia archaeon]|nr:glycosyl hydrolase [Candidatus Lokiarchaeia archaeon]
MQHLDPSTCTRSRAARLAWAGIFLLACMLGSLACASVVRPVVGFQSPVINTISYPIGSAFGMNHVGGTEAARASAEGVQLERGDIYWSSVEQVYGVYNFAGFETFIQQLEAQHIQPLVTMDYGNNVLYGSNFSDYVSPLQVPHWLAYINASVYHFRNYSIDWEMWNEPNLSWTGPEDQFFSLMNLTANFIHDHYPNQTIIAPGISGTDTGYLDRMIQYFGETSFNMLFHAIAIHPYFRTAEEVLPRLQSVRQLAIDDHYSGQIWITEYGYSVNTDYSDQYQLQADMLLKVYAQALSMNISKACWYCYDEQGLGIEQYNDLAGAWQLRPSGKTFALLSSTLTNGSYYPRALAYSIAPTIDPDLLWCFSYLTNRHTWLLALWTQANSITITLDFGALSGTKDVPGGLLQQLDYGNNFSYDLPVQKMTDNHVQYSCSLSLEPIILEVNLNAFTTLLGLNPATPVDNLPAISASITYTTGYLAFIVGIPAVIIAGITTIIVKMLKQRKNP